MADKNTNKDTNTNTAPCAENPGNAELLDIAAQLESDTSPLPDSKAEVAAKDAQAQAREASLQKTAGIVKKGLYMLAGAACAKYKELEKVWTEEAIDRIGRAAAAVLLKHGIEGGEFMQKYAEEIELLMAAGEPLLVSYFIIKKAKETEIKTTGGLSTGEASDTVQPVALDKPSNATVLA
jgi:hypothetical protein